jgi:predicted negative regulator of RcsB-dependent stress response
MDFKKILKKIAPYVAIPALFAAMCAAYFAPQFEGKEIPMHDVVQYEGMSKDIKDLRNNHDEDLKDIQEELCVLNYAVLAALDALKQQGYNGGVTDARDKLEKHINNKAHKK